MNRPRVAVITGPTAAGKTKLAVQAAHALEREGIPPCVISMDSMQVYRYMDIGTDKPSLEEREGVPHYLIDVVDPDQTFSAALFAQEASRIVEAMAEQGGAAILAGGTGFYLRAFLWGLFPGPARDDELRARLKEEAEREGIDALHRRLQERDPTAAARIHPRDQVRIIRALEVIEKTGEPISSHFARHDRSRPRYHPLVLGLALEREEMYRRINIRVERMMEKGLVQEVERLRRMGYHRNLPSQRALGYKQIHMLLDGEISEEEAVSLIKRDTRRYAKRQLTWLKKEPGLTWVRAEDQERLIARIVSFFLEGMK